MKYVVWIVVLTAPAALWAGWGSEIVASNGDVGDDCSLAVDRWGRPHISFFDKTNERVMYARFVSSAWEINTVATDVEVAGNTALALDAFDSPHIVFLDNVEDELIYAYRSGASWATEVVDSGEDCGVNVSISAWPTGPCIAYTYASGLTTYLKYAYRDGDGWETETVGIGGTNNKLIVDAEGAPHIFHCKETTIQHSVKEDEDWETEDLANGMYCHATRAPNGEFYVSFVNHENTELHYGRYTGSEWAFEEATGVTGSPTLNQICVNVAGDVFISYFDQTAADIQMMRKEATSWTREVVAEDGYVGYPHSNALGDDGFPLIAYYDAENGDLDLARYDPSAVELTSFTARRAQGGVEVRWSVRRAESVAGYNLYREAEGAERAKVNDALVTGSSPFLFRDDAARAGIAYDYWLEAVAATGTGQTFGPATVPPATKCTTFALAQNVPNPVTGATTFSFELPEGGDVTLAVYDAAGRKVAGVAEGYFAAGRHDVGFQNHLPPGVYVYRLNVGAETAARRMVVVK